LIFSRSSRPLQMVSTCQRRNLQSSKPPNPQSPKTPNLQTSKRLEKPYKPLEYLENLCIFVPFRTFDPNLLSFFLVLLFPSSSSRPSPSLQVLDAVFLYVPPESKLLESFFRVVRARC
jgi:hypothetical protein